MRIVIGEGEVRAVWSDLLLPLLEGLGPMRVSRATSCEWEDGEWVARIGGQVVARGRERGPVIAAEIRWLEERL